jgi:hypothetical protein
VTENQLVAARKIQFDLRALLCATAVVSMALAYLRSFDSTLMGSAAIVVAGAALVGILVGWRSHRIVDSTFWGVLGGIFAFLSAVQVVSYHCIWGWTGAVAGAAVGCVAVGRPLRTMLVGAGATTATFGFFVLAFYAQSTGEIWWDLLAAPMIGAMFGLLVEIFVWIESRSKLPRYVTATVLMIAVCVGNLLAR